MHHSSTQQMLLDVDSTPGAVLGAPSLDLFLTSGEWLIGFSFSKLGCGSALRQEEWWAGGRHPVAPERLLAWEPGCLSIGSWNTLDSSRSEVCVCCLLSGMLFPALARTMVFLFFTSRFKFPLLTEVLPVHSGRSPPPLRCYSHHPKGVFLVSYRSTIPISWGKSTRRAGTLPAVFALIFQHRILAHSRCSINNCGCCLESDVT